MRTYVAVLKKWDRERRIRLVDFHVHTGRAVLLYASAWLQQPNFRTAPLGMGLIDEDLQGVEDVCGDLEGPDLDLIVHSPGGYASSAHTIGALLRDRFDHIRVFVPMMAKSSASLLVCVADEIWMADHSFLGPIDPRVRVRTAFGHTWMSATNVLAQFDRAANDCRDPRRLQAWAPLLAQLGPDLLERCEREREQAHDVAGRWLNAHTFGAADGDRARRVAAGLSDRRTFVSPSRLLSRTWLQELGLPVRNLEDAPILYRRLLDVHRATVRLFDAPVVMKIIENHRGGAFFEPTSLVAAVAR